MKKVLAYLLIIVSAAAMLAGCQATPEEPVVAQKDMEQMIEKAVGKGAENFSVESVKTGERYQTTLVSSKGDVEVKVDAQVVFPAQESLPICCLKRGTFPQEKIDVMVTELLRGNVLHERLEALTKDDTLRYLRALYEMRGSREIHFDGDYNDPEAELERRIMQCEEMLADAPDTHMGKVMSTALQKIDGEGIDLGRGFKGCAQIDGKNANIFVRVNKSNASIAFGLSDRSAEPPWFSSPEEGEDDAHPQLACGLAAQDAQQVAESFLSRIGVADMMCVESSMGFASDSFENRDEPYSRCWSLKYRRSVNQVPIMIDVGGGSDDEYAQPWISERMSFLVDDSGIIAFQWESPYTTPEVISQDSQVMPLEEIKEVFEKMILIVNDWVNADGGTDNHLTIDIDHMELGLVRIVRQDSDGEGVLVPAWIFYGTKTYRGSAGGILPAYEPQLLLNAIDGTVIDMSLGY